MKLSELKQWINSLPDEFLDFNVVNSQEGIMEEFTYRLDTPVIAVDVDESDSEILIFTNPIPDNDGESTPTGI